MLRRNWLPPSRMVTLIGFGLKSRWIKLCCHIDADELDAAYDVYRAMVEQLMADWIN